MEKRNDKLGASFNLPDRITVRQQLAYFSEAGLAHGDELFLRLWYGARKLISDWKCEAFPDPSVNLDEVDDPRIAEVVLWAGMEVKTHMDRLDTIPKN